jgi:hypothetical protein
MFEKFKQNKYFYLTLISIFVVSSYIGSQYSDAFKPNDEYALIKDYLLNDSPLYGFNRPKIWIHTKYEYNARKWKSFQSRSSQDLNQPYIHLTIKTIIDHCGDDFHICLIDDNTFSKLIPSWKETNLATVAEPMKSQLRQIGLAELVYYYGGMVLPNSFVCGRPLKSFYESAIAGNQPFVCQNINRNENLLKNPQRQPFLPETYIMGAPKNNETVKELVEYLKKRNKTPHFSSDRDFLGDTSQWCMNAIREQKMTLIGGEYVGVKTAKGKPVLLDDLMEETYLDLHTDCVGIYIPENELLSRKRYQWFAVMPTDELMNTNMAITRYMKIALVDGSKDMYSNPATEQRSVTSI